MHQHAQDDSGESEVHEEMLVHNATVLHDVTLEPERIEVGGDLAHAFGWFNCGVDTPDGQRVEWPAHLLTVRRKEPAGAWRIARVHHAQCLTALDHSARNTTDRDQMRTAA